jgi:hypothetical protein
MDFMVRCFSMKIYTQTVHMSWRGLILIEDDAVLDKQGHKFPGRRDRQFFGSRQIQNRHTIGRC